ncbi:SDR family NAD(P)-dependent oxidoreductase, partial [Kitasatospora sp. NPDC086791]|uniref:SDR family NAD(P)-dependent oxidoreductase n=1 Tax=Kitasatospora sp. NPDC086791 TaxID=3155178 RepID=UPI00343EBC0A
MTHNDNDALVERAVAYFKRLLSKATKLPVDRIDSRAPFEDLGIDSVMAMDMTAELEAVFGSLPKTLFFEFRDLRGVARHFAEEHGPALRALVGAEEPGTGGTRADAGAPAGAAPAPRPRPRAAGAPARKPLAATRWATRADVAPARQSVSEAPAPAPASTPTDRADRTGLDIAIVGLSGRYPGARTLEEFWANLADGRDSVTEIPADRWDHGPYFDPDRDAPGKTYSKWGGFLDGAAEFDPLFFHISPAEAELMDPQERLFLQCVHETVEDAGYTPARLNAPAGQDGPAARVGVYVGVMYEEYQLYGAQEQVLGHPVALSGNSSAVANRVSYHFDFRGPSMSVDTMCSSSITAIHLACQAIRSGVCDAAVAGGVNLSLHPNKYLMLGQGKFVSGKGRCESFGRGGDGYVPGEGVGAVLLKPLERAVRDGDRIHGVIRGVAVNHGGRSTGYAVPSPVAQARSVSDAWQQAGVDPRAVGYIEAHGTGTALGDPIEIAGLTKAFREHTRDTGFCAIGSVKSNIGHCESAAGISGLTKVLLQMRHGKLVPSLHSDVLNPHIDFDDTPFTVQQELADWKRPVAADGSELPRVAGLSSFGAGGSNAHLVVEEYRPQPPAAPAPVTPAAPVLVVLSARSTERLREKAAQLVDWIHTQALTPADLPALGRTLQIGREAMRERLGAVVPDLPALLAVLTAFRDGDEQPAGSRRGRAGGDSDALARTAEEQGLAAATAERDLDRLLGLWIQGVTVDWDALYDGDAPARIGLPTYPFARDRYWIDTTRTTAAMAAGRTAAAEAPAVPAATVLPATVLPAVGDLPADLNVLTEAWEPEPLRAGPPAPARTVVCLGPADADPAELTAVAAALAPDTRLVVVTQGRGHRNGGPDVHWFDADEPGDLTRVLTGIRVRYGAVDGLLQLRTLTEVDGPASHPATAQLLRSVAESGAGVRRIVQAGTFRDGLERAHCEAWLGFGRSIARVLPDTAFLAVFEEAPPAADRPDTAAWLARLLAELDAPEAAGALYRDGVRHVCRVRPGRTAAGPDLLRRHGTYLVTGGLGGLGLMFAEHLARTRSARLVLTGRSPLDAAKRRRIARLEELGGEVLYCRADVADRTAMAEAVRAAHGRFGTLDGVLHAAGVAGEGSVLTNDAAEFGARTASKVTGTLVLDELLADEPLDFVCYFSSTAAVLGDFGSCDYAVGNRFQTAYAGHRNALVRQGLRTGATVAFNWPLWRGGGMGFEDAQGAELYLSASGLRLLEQAEGLSLFERLLGQGADRHLVLAGEPARVRRLLGVDPEPAAAASSAASSADDTPNDPNTLNNRNTPNASPTEDAAHTALSPGSEHVDLDAQVLSDLETLIGDTLRVPREQIHADENLAQLGFDSVNLAKLAGAMSGRFGFEVLPSVFFSHPTPQKLVAFLTAEHGDALRLRYAPTQAAAPAAAQAEPRAEAQVEPQNPAAGRTTGVMAAGAGTAGPQAGPEPIAVVGMSGRFPAARTVDELWDILAQGRDVLSAVPEDRRADWTDPEAQDPRRTRVGFVPGVAEFDPAFFEISPREAQGMDPRQRLLLQEAWRALEHAGYGRRRLRDEQIGMFVGAEQGDYLQVTGGEGSITAQHEAITASRLAYVLDFSGPVLAVNTACSSGLAAAHQACASLRNGECDAAVVAGVNLATTSRVFAETSKAGMLSESGVCRAFDQRADGMVLGEAIAVVVLKRLSRAEADGDTILAVIRGSGMNYDGRTNGITAPNGAAQAKLYRDVHKRHGIDPARIGHVVAHGTGTRLGDPVEVNALDEVFRAHTDGIGTCALTSVKPNVGHTLAASGLVSLIALVQSLRHGVIPASLHCEQDSDYIPWARSPFRVNKTATPWPAGPGGTRLGAVSSFGMSGTNVHMVVESHAAAARPVTSAPARLLTLSAKTPEALAERVRELREALRTGGTDSTGGTDGLRLGDVAYTLLDGRQHFAHRCALVVTDTEDALAALAAVERGEDPVGVRRGVVPRDAQDRSLLDVQVGALTDRLTGPDVSATRYRDVLTALAALYCQGAEPDARQLFAGEQPRPVPLPGYPFARTRHWPAKRAAAPAAAAPVAAAAAVVPAPVAVTAAPAPVVTVPRERAEWKPIVLARPSADLVVTASPAEKPRNLGLGGTAGTGEPLVTAAAAPVPAPAAVSAAAPVPAPVPTPAPAAVPAGPVAAPVKPLAELRQEIRASLSEALYLAESEIDLGRNFMELGLDSIVGVEWVKTLNKKYGTALTATRLYDYPSVREFADFLRGELAAARPAEPPAPSAVPA